MLEAANVEKNVAKKLRQRAFSNQDIFEKLSRLENQLKTKLKRYDQQIIIVNLMITQHQPIVIPKIYYALSASRLQQLSEKLSTRPNANCKKCLAIGFRFTDEPDSWKRNDMVQCECTQ